SQRNCDLPPDQVGKLIGICNDLWAMFEAGLYSRDSGISEPSKAVKDKAWALSGCHLIQKIGHFPPEGEHHVTMGCAFLCGVEARDLALAKNTTSITDVDYQDAWDKVKTRIGPLL